MSKKQLTIFIISCVILLALIGGWVFWYLTRPSLQQDNQPTAETEDQKSKIINLKSEIDTSDWLTYRNEEYGFEVKYPEGWVIKNGNPIFEDILTLTSPETEKNIREAVSRGRATEIPEGDIVISSIDTKGKTLEDYLNYNLEIQKSGLSNIDLVKFNKIKFNNYEAYEALLGGFSAYYTIYIENDKRVCRILFELKEDKNQLSDTENKIINSFKFIN